MDTTDHPPTAPSALSCWILLDSQVSISNAPHRNESTSMAPRKNGRAIEVSVSAAPPPNPSRLHVHCPSLEPGETFIRQPCIVNTAGGFVLLRLSVGCPPSSSSISSRSARIRWEMSDYFIYHLAGPGVLPSLRRLPRPPTRFFQNYEVALLPRGDHFTVCFKKKKKNHFTVAALSATARTGSEFELHSFKSEDWSWDTEVVALREPVLPENDRRRQRHITSTAITIGGQRGTVGWVDLWQGVLLCDLLTENRSLRHVPMPRRQNHRECIDCCPKPFRGVAVVGGALRVADLEIHGDRLPENDPETQGPSLRIDDWTLTTYTKGESATTTDSWAGDWVTDGAVRASDTEIEETARAVLLRCGRFYKPNNGEAAADQRNLQNLYTCQPVLGLDDRGIVYLLARLKFMHRHAWILAVDTRKNCVEAMVKIATERSKDFLLAYCAASTISS